MVEKINVIKNEKDTLEIEIIGGEEGLGELLVEYLNEEKDVEFAAYKKEHPMDKGIKVVVKSKKSPKKAFLTALKRTGKEISEFEKLFAKV